MNWKELLLSHQGRIRRKSFLMGLGPVVILIALVYLYVSYIGWGVMPGWLHLGVLSLLVVEALYFLGILSIKRLRDIGRSPLFLLIMFSPLAVAAVFLLQQKFFKVQSQEPMVLAYTLAITLAVVGFFWILIELLFRRSFEEQGLTKEAEEDTKGDDEQTDKGPN